MKDFVLVFCATLLSICAIAQDTSPEFEIIDIAIISDSCEGDWYARKKCSQQEVSNYLLEHLDWSAMDSVVHGAHKLVLNFSADSEGAITDLKGFSPNMELNKACVKIGETWPIIYRYIRQDGLSIVGDYTTSFSFYF